MVVPTVVKTITQGMKLDTMTHVQSLTINETLKGGDVYVGRGPSLLFFLLQPKLTHVLQYSAGAHRNRKDAGVSDPGLAEYH